MMKFELSETEPKSLELYLQSKGVIKADSEIIGLAKAGEGNMNLTLRAELEGYNLIVKQANPFVQKYPSIPAPVERSEMEYTFYERAGTIDSVSSHLPRPLFQDPENHILVIEDLGKGGDFSRYYARENDLPTEIVRKLILFLSQLHESTKGGQTLANEKMRRLNHTHIFDLPFDPNGGIDLDEIQPGLQDLANDTVLRNTELRERARELGMLYLSAGGRSLLHGDFFPGSWLDTSDGVKVIDPEFCFTGPAEFDLGVFKAHLIFCGISSEAIKTLFRRYGDFEASLADDFAGIEILRRLFGVAQLPMERTITEKENLSKKALNLLNL